MNSKKAQWISGTTSHQSFAIELFDKDGHYTDKDARPFEVIQGVRWLEIDDNDLAIEIIARTGGEHIFLNGYGLVKAFKRCLDVLVDGYEHDHKLGAYADADEE